MFNFKIGKMSKFIDKLMERLSEKKDTKKIAERAFGKATNKVNAQVASLKFERMELEDKLDDANEALEAVTFCEHFDLVKYDSAKTKVDGIQENIEMYDDTISAREKLIEQWN